MIITSNVENGEKKCPELIENGSNDKVERFEYVFFLLPFLFYYNIAITISYDILRDSLI